MYALMLYQTGLSIEFLFTHITSIRKFTAMYTFMFYQIILLTE